MTSLSERARATRQQIERAFAETPYPGDANIVASTDDPEGREIVADLAGRHWKEITKEQLRALGWALPPLTPAAFRHYLPAYMIGCMDSYHDMGAALDGAIFNLTPPTQRSGWAWDHFWVRAQQFDSDQRNAIRSFLELMQQYDYADWATEDREPPTDRVAPGLAYWMELGQQM